MTLEHVIKVNNTVCRVVNPTTIIMYGRKKNLHNKVVVENHVLTGKFKAVKRN